jgi:hypothetical protein
MVSFGYDLSETHIVLFLSQGAPRPKGSPLCERCSRGRDGRRAVLIVSMRWFLRGHTAASGGRRRSVMCVIYRGSAGRVVGVVQAAIM